MLAKKATRKGNELVKEVRSQKGVVPWMQATSLTAHNLC